MDGKLKVLLTGAGGMVGRNLQEHPIVQRWEVLCPTSKELDLRDFLAAKRYLAAEQPDLVIHAAGLVGGIQANISRPVDFLVENLDIGRNTILAAREAGVRRLINLGSSCMYPRNAPNPLREEMILTGELEPTNEGYAMAKIFAARLCRYIEKEDSAFQYKTLIPCNLYGRFDSFSPDKSHLIPSIIRKTMEAISQGSNEIEIWGDGKARREFMSAADLADAIAYAAVNFEETPSVLNVGLGIDHSVNEYYETVAQLLNWNGVFVHDLTRPVGMHQKLVDISRQTNWGWRATRTLTTGIKEAIDYYTKECMK